MATRRRHTFLLAAIAVTGLVPVASVARAGEAAGITLAAAMSLREVLPPMIEAFRKQAGAAAVTVTYGASGELRRQVDAGAPVDAVIFASAADVDLLVAQGRIADGTRRVVATNSLVLIGPRGAAPLTFATLDQVPAGELIAVGNPESVPAGHYAREALRALHQWDSIQDRVVYGGHVAAVLQYARRGEVVAAVVYASDVRGVDDVVILDRASGTWAPRIETVAAAVRGGDEAAARAFLEFVGSPAGQELLAAHGFSPAEISRAAAAP